jgi:hypothetical protein
VGNAYSGWTRYTLPILANGPVNNVVVYSGSERATGIIESSVNINNLTFRIKYWFISPTNYELEEIYERTGD